MPLKKYSISKSLRTRQARHAMSSLFGKAFAKLAWHGVGSWMFFHVALNVLPAVPLQWFSLACLGFASAFAAHTLFFVDWVLMAARMEFEAMEART